MALLIHQGGIQRLLPYSPEIDEDIFVRPAIRMAATGSLNPGWFGHPGSTTIYPLAAWYYFSASAPWQTDNAELSAIARGQQAVPSSYFLAGRQLSIFYSLGTLLLIFLLGRALQGYRLGVIALWIAATVPISVSYAQVVRTDSAATFYGVLSLWAFSRAHRRPSARNYLLAGAAIGLGVASRYFMVALVPAAAVSVWLSTRSTSTGTGLRRPLVLKLAVVLAGAVAAFAATSPFSFLDWQALRQTLAAEAVTSHLGADGLSAPGNLAWYLGESFPRTVGWLTVAFAGVGVSATPRKSGPTWAVWVIMVAFFCTFLAGLSLSPLHWHRWTIPLIPVVALFAARGICLTTDRMRTGRRWRPAARPFVEILAVVVVTAVPSYELAMFQLQERNGGVRLAARSWIVDNIPAGNRIASDAYAAPLSGTPFMLDMTWSLAEGRDIGYYQVAGFDYIMTSSAISKRYLAANGEHDSKRIFYEELEHELVLVWEGTRHLPSLWPGRAIPHRTCPCYLWPVEGPLVIRIFAVGPSNATSGDRGRTAEAGP